MMATTRAPSSRRCVILRRQPTPSLPERQPMSNSPQFEDQIRAVLRDHGRLNKDVSQIEPDADLYQAGMTSHASVNVMLGLEGAFDVEFPDHMLKRNVFNSIQSISTALHELVASWAMPCKVRSAGSTAITAKRC